MHVSKATVECLKGVYEVEPGLGMLRDQYLKVGRNTNFQKVIR